MLCTIVSFCLSVKNDGEFLDGGLTKNDKTATFTALKIYRDGSEFGTVRYSIGYAFRAGNKDAMLQLHSRYLNKD